jgi:hypothetical protein
MPLQVLLPPAILWTFFGWSTFFRGFAGGVEGVWFTKRFTGGIVLKRSGSGANIVRGKFIIIPDY